MGVAGEHEVPAVLGEAIVGVWIVGEEDDGGVCGGAGEDARVEMIRPEIFKAEEAEFAGAGVRLMEIIAEHVNAGGLEGGADDVGEGEVVEGSGEVVVAGGTVGGDFGGDRFEEADEVGEVGLNRVDEISGDEEVVGIELKGHGEGGLEEGVFDARAGVEVGELDEERVPAARWDGRLGMGRVSSVMARL